jgi:hypothetical protein
VLQAFVPVLLVFSFLEVEDPRLQLGLVANRDLDGVLLVFFLQVHLRYESTNEAVHDLVLVHVVGLVEENVRAYYSDLILFEVFMLSAQVASSLFDRELVNLLTLKILCKVAESSLGVSFQKILNCEF